MTKRLTRRESLKLSATFGAGLCFVNPEDECMKPESSIYWSTSHSRVQSVYRLIKLFV